MQMALSWNINLSYLKCRQGRLFSQKIIYFSVSCDAYGEPTNASPVSPNNLISGPHSVIKGAALGNSKETCLPSCPESDEKGWLWFQLCHADAPTDPGSFNWQQRPLSVWQHCNLKIFEFWTVGQTKQVIQRCHLVFWDEIVMGVFSVWTFNRIFFFSIKVKGGALGEHKPKNCQNVAEVVTLWLLSSYCIMLQKQWILHFP